MAIKTPAYFKWRGGRPRWEPGPGVRRQGHQGRDLKSSDGSWLGLEAAIAAADAINAEIKRSQPARPRTPVLGRTPKAERTCHDLWREWQGDPAFKLLAKKTRDDYGRKIQFFLAEFGDAPVRAVTKPQLRGFWKEAFGDRGHHMANAILAVASAMFTHAELIGWRDEMTNPARQMKRPTPEERRVLWLPAELAHIVATADRLGLQAVGDAVTVALHSGQRQADVLALPPRIFEDGRIKLTQFKTQALVDAPMTDILAARVGAIRARWREAGVATRATIVARDDGEQFAARGFHELFADVRTEAIKTMPSIAGKTFQDLRDTAVTRLALADCTIPQIGAITGHSPKTITQVIQHYLVMQPEIADAAIDKLQVWLTKFKISV